jgi:hypothetical protein
MNLQMTACDANGIVDSGTEQFHSLRDLAKRFALSFGVDNIKNRDAMAMVHHVNFGIFIWKDYCIEKYIIHLGWY